MKSTLMYYRWKGDSELALAIPMYTLYILVFVFASVKMSTHEQKEVSEVTSSLMCTTKKSSCRRIKYALSFILHFESENPININTDENVAYGKSIGVHVSVSLGV